MDLQLLTGADLKTISVLFLARGVGRVAGNISGGILCDKFNRDILMIINNLTVGLILITVPWTSSLLGFCAAFLAISGSNVFQYIGTTIKNT